MVIIRRTVNAARGSDRDFAKRSNPGHPAAIKARHVYFLSLTVQNLRFAGNKPQPLTQGRKAHEG